MQKYISLQNSLLSISLVLCMAFYGKYGHQASPFYGDSLGYYLYLPSTFIFHNLKNIEALPLDRGVDASIFQYTDNIPNLNPKSPTGYHVNQYTYGIALMEMPFFALAHVYEIVRGLPANGYSNTYALLLKISSIFYCLVGLLFTYKILLCYTKPLYAMLTTCLVLVATNLFWFTLYQSAMSHVPLFFLYAVLIYLTIKMHEQAKWHSFLLVGFVAGIITIIRPTDILCLIIPALYNVYDRTSFIAKKKFVAANFQIILLAALCFMLALIPQLLYWKMTSGSFLYYSYGTQTFNWLNPQIMKGLFSASNGWLYYSPIFILAILGFIYLKHFKSIASAISLLFPIYIYVIYCWFCYNYINGFGSRPMIHLYSLLAIPMALLLHKIFESHLIKKAFLLVFILFCISANIAQSGQQARGDLYAEESNYQFNFTTLFKSKLSYNDLLTLDLNESQPTKKIQLLKKLGCVNYSDSADVLQDSFLVKYTSIGQNEYPPIFINITYQKDTFKNAVYFKCNGYFKNPVGFYDWYHNHLFVLSISRHGENIFWKAVKINNKVGIEANSANIHLQRYRDNKWGYTPFHVRIPTGLENNDMIRLGIWNIGKQELFVNNISLELCK